MVAHRTRADKPGDAQGRANGRFAQCAAVGAAVTMGRIVGMGFIVGMGRGVRMGLTVATGLTVGTGPLGGIGDAWMPRASAM